MKLSILVNLISILILIFIGDAVAAIEVENPLKFETFCALIVALAEALFLISLATGTVVIVYAGFLFITSSGEPNKIKSAKEALFFGIIGIIVGASAKGIVAVIYTFFGSSLSSCGV